MTFFLHFYFWPLWRIFPSILHHAAFMALSCCRLLRSDPKTATCSLMRQIPLVSGAASTPESTSCPLSAPPHTDGSETVTGSKPESHVARCVLTLYLSTLNRSHMHNQPYFQHKLTRTAKNYRVFFPHQDQVYFNWIVILSLPGTVISKN